MLNKFCIVFAMASYFSTQIGATKLECRNSNDTLPSADRLWNSQPILSSPEGIDLFPLLSTRNEEEKEKLATINQFKYVELYSLSLREWGKNFWNCYPNDPRRFKWLIETITLPPHYYISIESGAEARYSGNYEYPLDTNKMRNWDDQYKAFRLELLNSDQITNKERVEFLEAELISLFQNERMQWKYARYGMAKVDLEKWAKEVLSLSHEYVVAFPQKGFDPIINASERFFLYSDTYGLSFEDLRLFATTLSKSEFQELRDYGEKKIMLLDLRKNALKLQFKTVDGQDVDLERMRGKLILIDFWATYCSSCIEKMPEIKRVYEKYRNDGFEVISICINNETDKKRVLEIYKKIGAQWPLLLMGGSAGRPNFSGGLAKVIFEKYGFNSVPQLLLIDKKGVLIAYQGELLTKGKLDTLVRKYLF